MARMPLGRPFDGFVELAKRVSPTCLIAFEKNRYSVPASFANRPVRLRVYPERLVVVAAGQLLCGHVRYIDMSNRMPCTIYDWRHYLTVVQRKPGALRNGAPFLEMPKAFRDLQAKLLNLAEVLAAEGSVTLAICPNQGQLPWAHKLWGLSERP